ncbi:tyrosine-type recombinase/integrase [Luteococcus sanguinis]|uniref:Tyrosine-type recombinase/integrase n=1 Tax=Luteococcus sanguinis TaxID=174038 RepID=A0ABW1X064_9ACTN
MHSADHTFVAKIDAEGWLVDVERSISRGEWQALVAPQPALVKEEAPVEVVFEDLARDEVARRDLTPRTRALYESLLDRLILPEFGDQAVASITPKQVRAWFDRMGPERATQRSHAYALLKSLLAVCVDEELIVVNPCRIRSAGQRKTTRAMQPATVAELNRVADRLPPGQALPVLLAAWCGLRSGEVRALRVGDVDTATGWIHVRQGVTRIKGQVIVGPPKTPAAIREVGIPPHLLSPLREWRAGLGERRARSAYFFPGRGELPMSEKALRYAFDQARDVMDRHDLTFHDLRHTAATMAAQNGATTAELMARMGHTTAQMAMRYQHASRQREQLLAERLAELARGGDGASE